MHKKTRTQSSSRDLRLSLHSIPHNKENRHKSCIVQTSCHSNSFGSHVMIFGTVKIVEEVREMSLQFEEAVNP
jgi:hypothetical protein